MSVIDRVSLWDQHCKHDDEIEYRRREEKEM
jgi:hypothetical protein